MIRRWAAQAGLPFFHSALCAICAFLWLYYPRQGGRPHGKHFKVYDPLSVLRSYVDDRCANRRHSFARGKSKTARFVRRDGQRPRQAEADTRTDLRAGTQLDERPRSHSRRKVSGSNEAGRERQRQALPQSPGHRLTTGDHLMVRTSIRLALSVLLLASLQLTGFAQTRNPQLKFTDRTLANGMRVLAAPDRSSPTVAIQVWYHVGSKDDPPNRSGFAHLFEHIMFKSTKNMKSEMMDRLTEDVGGFNNAFTNDDVTVYFEVVPSNYLETLIWAEADRLSGLNVDDANFKSERDVVKEEYRQSVLAPPYGRFEYLLQQKSFLEHPYKRPTIGSIEDLDAASLKDVQDFHSTFYQPDNATLVVVGDFDSKQLDAWVDKYFAPIEKPSRPLPRVQVKEPPRKSETRLTDYGSNDLP